jgi:hypothetical protein
LAGIEAQPPAGVGSTVMPNRFPSNGTSNASRIPSAALRRAALTLAPAASQIGSRSTGDPSSLPLDTNKRTRSANTVAPWPSGTRAKGRRGQADQDEFIN